MIGTEAGVRNDADPLPPVVTINAAGASPFLLVCDHASNRIPPRYGDLGLLPHQRLMHIAWDPGALAVAIRLSGLLDAPLIHSTVSRLIIDCNRDHDAIDLIPVISERTEIPANIGLSQAERDFRIASYHQPFHVAIESAIEERLQAGMETILVTVHSFTPTYKDVVRPWPIGLIHGVEERFSHALLAALQAEDPELNVGWNQPYSARNGVTYTLEHHGDGRGLDCTMIEIRHDEILEPAGIDLWADRLARTLERARGALAGLPGSLGQQTASQPGGRNG
ncbi:MAG TPA: N-formylglutamate amidohydrolase [Devosia sp.]